jgi:hypothetical protein
MGIAGKARRAEDAPGEGLAGIAVTTKGAVTLGAAGLTAWCRCQARLFAPWPNGLEGGQWRGVHG